VDPLTRVDTAFQFNLLSIVVYRGVTFREDSSESGQYISSEIHASHPSHLEIVLFIPRDQENLEQEEYRELVTQTRHTRKT